MRCCNAAKLGRPVVVEADNLAVEHDPARAEHATQPTQLGIAQRDVVLVATLQAQHPRLCVPDRPNAVPLKFKSPAATARQRPGGAPLTLVEAPRLERGPVGQRTVRAAPTRRSAYRSWPPLAIATLGPLLHHSGSLRLWQHETDQLKDQPPVIDWLGRRRVPTVPDDVVGPLIATTSSAPPRLGRAQAAAVYPE